MQTYVSIHNHTDYSNLKLIDSINKVEELIDYAYELGLKGVAITDHDCLTAHVRALNYYYKKYKDTDFKLILGNEIYLTREGLTAETHDVGEKFYHCILLAIDEIGHRQLRELSSRAWTRGYVKFIMRTPTYLSDIEEIVGSNPGHLICTTACLGGMPGTFFTTGQVERIDPILAAMRNVFGEDNFFIELQPSHMKDQLQYNAYMIENYWDEYKFVVATDSHYLKAEEREIHKTFLNSKDGKGNREVDEFYASAYMMSAEEIHCYMDNHLGSEIVDNMMRNTIAIGERIKMYSLDCPQIVPKIQYEWAERDYMALSDLRDHIGNRPQLQYYCNSEVEADKYLALLIAEGYKKLIGEFQDEYLDRLEEELETFKAISDNIKQPLSDYFNTMAKIIDIVWTDGDSLVGPGRGSGCGCLINYLLGITQLDPLRQELNMPFWRFLHPSRPELPDIDFDTEALKRNRILKAVTKYFNSIGSEVINVCTIGTIKTKSAIRTAGRSLGIDDVAINYIVSLVPNERGNDWTLQQCMYGDAEHTRIGQFASQMAQFPDLWNVANRISGLVSNLSVHASGVLILNGSITEHNSVMKTSRKVMVTAWDLHDSEQLGALKYDFLTVQAIDKIRTTMNLLLEDQQIEWCGNLRETYNNYLLPKNLDYTSPEMWDMVGNGEIMELFQYDTAQGSKAARLIKPRSLKDLAAGNSVLRLMSDEGEQPLDTFAKYKSNPNLWYQEMIMAGLSNEEQELMEKHLKPVYGVAPSQELMMMLSMDPQIAGFTVKEANKLRKAVAKKKKDLVDECHELFYAKGRELGTSEALLDYVWNVQIHRQVGYSFSDLHTTAYSTIALQEMNVNYTYDPIYWACACLNVNANAVNEADYEFLVETDIIEVDEEEEEESKSGKVAYDKVAEAISKFDQYEIIPPDINNARMGFIPKVYDNKIMFGLKGISKIGDDLVLNIIDHRPYTSLQNFVEKMVEDGKKLISKDRVVNLIKAGCFDAIEGKPREQIMEEFISSLVPKKSTVNLRNVQMLIRYNLFPEELKFEKGVFIVHNEIKKSLGVHVPCHYCLDSEDDIIYQWYTMNLGKEPLRMNDHWFVTENEWGSIYKKAQDKARVWIKDNVAELIEAIHEIEYKEEFDKYANGDKLQWELDSLNFYHSGHPLTDVSYPFETTALDELKENDYDGYWQIKGVTIPKINLRTITGTVLVKNKKSNIVVLSCPDGVMKVKCYKVQFAKYDKVAEDESGEELQDSFFEKGTHLSVTGFLRDGMFIPKVYKKNGTDPIMKIVIGSDGQFNCLENKI
jgi:DNA polymerase-3 subunit alpha